MTAQLDWIDDYGMGIAIPIEYNVCICAKFWAGYVVSIFCCSGYISDAGVIERPLIDGTKNLPDECKFATEQDAKNACQEHFRPLITGIIESFACSEI